MKKHFLLLVFIAVCFRAFAAIDHGSIMGRGFSLYPIRDGAAPGVAVNGVTFDFKAVTIGMKTWICTNLNGKSIDGNNWSSQFRLWYPDRQESNLLNRIPNTQQTYGTTGIPNVYPCMQNVGPCVITFLQEENNNFYETADIIYDYVRPNSADANDKTPPVWQNSPIVSQIGEGRIHLSLSATDNSGNFFYYIEDRENGFVEVSFFDETVVNIDINKIDNLSVYAVDFSGNYSSSYSSIHLDIPAIEANAVSVYPNPSGGALYIKGINSRVSVRILDLSGKTVLSQVLSEEKIDISELSRGIYFLKIKDQTVKFIKK